MEGQELPLNPTPTDGKPLLPKWIGKGPPQGWLIVDTSIEDTPKLPDDFRDNDHDGMD